MQDNSFSAKRPPSVGFVSLGCPKALVDSERILTQLKVEGYEVSASYEGADLIVVNTCGFIDSAVQESLDAIGEAMHANGKVIVTGCLGAKNGNEGKELITSLHPKVLAVTGPHATEEVMQAVHTHLPKPHDPFIDLVPDHGVKLTPKHYAYLKISEGCNHRCTFCIIPDMRGDLVSRPIGEVIREADSLKKSGVKELLVVSQDTSAYGVDLKYRTDFVNGRPVKTQFQQLAEELGELGIWVRMHYVYPYPHVDRVVPLMAEGKILPYLDIPFQHSHPDVLKRMKRPASGERNIERIRAWREACPDITLRSTFITGFPGETEDEFKHLLDFIEEAQLDRVGVFAYSPVEGAKANELANPVPEEVKEERRARLMELQEKISLSRNEAKLGKVMQVLVDETDEEGIVARSKADAPEIDGNVFIPMPEDKARQPKPGDFINVLIDDCDEHDLWGRRVD
ncbi:MAG TPA: 30S ribosomal protein S12 methylthiotransferase RimO [Limnobacter sp.]|nr:30S ribosomal protein S12 methylthiotransferase RimO [Limnobacter sp.]